MICRGINVNVGADENLKGCLLETHYKLPRRTLKKVFVPKCAPAVFCFSTLTMMKAFLFPTDSKEYPQTEHFRPSLSCAIGLKRTHTTLPNNDRNGTTYNNIRKERNKSRRNTSTFLWCLSSHGSCSSRNSTSYYCTFLYHLEYISF